MNEMIGKGERVPILILGVWLSVFPGKTFFCCPEILGCRRTLTKEQFYERSVDRPAHMDQISL